MASTICVVAILHHSVWLNFFFVAVGVDDAILIGERRRQGVMDLDRRQIIETKRRRIHAYIKAWSTWHRIYR